jgi:membrane-bound lytic murein transglycosylase D
VAKIKKWNNLKNDNIRVGQSLVIYRGGSGPSAAQTSSSKSSSSKNSSSGSSKSSSSGNTKITYTVKKGDALGKIAEAHGVGLSKIKEWNGLKNDNIKVGQKLIIYTSSKSSSSSVSAAKGHTTYTVKSGDTFYSIAKNYPGVSAQNIMDYNGIESSKIRAGMTIKIPQY